MDDDQQVAVLLQLNLNGARGLDTSWQNDFSTSSEDVSVLESNYKGNLNEESNNLLEKDFEFIKKHAANADPDFLHSLLNSHINNPKRLEAVMCEILNIPNGLELIQEFRKNPLKLGEKRSFNDPDPDPEEVKKKKSKDSESYLQQVRDMFPDADGLFLISECQQLESPEDFSRFINTVMISGVYPKKGVIEYSPNREPFEIPITVNDSQYRSSEIISSEEEVSSSDLSDSTKRKRRQKRKRESLVSQQLFPPEVEVIDIASDNTETYEPPDQESLQEIFQNNVADNKMEVVEEILPDPNWETSLDDDIEKLLNNKFGVPPADERNKPVLPEEFLAGPSRLKSPQRSPRLSLPGGVFTFFSPEKSLAEIIESKRYDRRRSLGARPYIPNLFPRPSTSRAEPQDFISEISTDSEVLGEETAVEVSSPEVSTTTEFKKKRNGSETDTTGLEDEDLSKTNENWLNEQTANLIRIFPNTDPSYLRKEVEKMDRTSEAVNEFVYSKLEKNDMPTLADYEKKKEMEELQNRYTKNFSIEDFLRAVPDPWKYFTQGNRNCAKYKNHSLCYLKSTYRKRFIRDIIDIFNKNNFNLYLSYNELKKDGVKRRGSRRSEFECNSNRPTTIDIQFLQEVAFIENEEKIKDYIEGEKIARQIKFDEAKRTGSLLECQCCFDSEVIVDDIVYCPKDHPFCKECVIKSVEVEMGNGRYQFECLASCDEKFTLASLQNVLKPELFSKVIQANQMEEIKAAQIDDLVQCPFCNYATIMPPEEKVMICLNPECLKESCRLCKELNHIPLRCDEVEKSEDVKMRTYIENKMTEALVRTCYKCNKKFVKEDGCNKMTCTCGAKMCYVCRKPVLDYSHFNGQGGTEYHKCPLYSRNDELHVDLVRKVGEDAKAEILQANPQRKLLHDPTIIMPERSNDDGMPGMNNGAAFMVALRAIQGIVQEQEPNENNGRCRRTYDLRLHNRHHRCHRDSEDENDEEVHHHHRRHQRHINEPRHHRHRHHHLPL